MLATLELFFRLLLQLPQHSIFANVAAARHQKVVAFGRFSILVSHFLRSRVCFVERNSLTIIKLRLMGNIAHLRFPETNPWVLEIHCVLVKHVLKPCVVFTL